MVRMGHCPTRVVHIIGRLPLPRLGDGGGWSSSDDWSESESDEWDSGGRA